MNQFNRIGRVTGVAAATLALSIFAVAGAAHSQTAAPKAAGTAKPKAAATADDPVSEKKKTADAGRASLDAGLKSHASAKHQLAADQLSSALRTGGLSSGDMARALYTRGLSYKALSKPGLAISDLTSALWLKNGLSEADRQAAMAQRAEAYQLAGLSDNGLGAERAVVANPNPPAAAAAPPVKVAIAREQQAVAPQISASSDGASSGSATSTWSSTPQQVTRQAPDSEAALDAARARKLAAAPVETNGLDAALVSRAVAAVPAPVQNEVSPMAMAMTSDAATPPPVAPAASRSDASAASPQLSALPTDASASDGSTPTVAAPSLGGLPSTVSGFFSNIFGGGNQQAATAEPPSAISTLPGSPIQTAAISPKAEAASSATTGSANGAGNSSGSSSVAMTAPPVVPSALAQPPVSKSKQANTGGKYKLHIAALRSRAEAETLAQQLASKHGGDLAQRAPTVDEAVIGSMGTFYRVRVGSYANSDEPRGVCNKLRISGFDCLVVTN